MKKKMIILILLIILIFGEIWFILYFNNYRIKQQIEKENTNNIIINDNVIDFDSLTLKQKIAQMIMVRGDKEQLSYNNLNIGGIFLDKQDSEEQYGKLINKYQGNSKIKLLVATDLEGAWTPFHNPKSHQEFPYFSEIKTPEEAYEIGLRHGELLKSIGFNLNFAPVAEYFDDVYGGRSFTGTKEEIKEKIGSYITGLQENILGTCKHYPGRAMEKNLHYQSDTQTITKDDLGLFETCLANNISAIMVSHQIVEGELNSKGKPSSVSKEVISTLNPSVLIIADEVNMRGLRKFYFSKNKMYIDLINSGENLILDFNLSPVSLYNLIEDIEEEVEKGDIQENKIDDSVRKILMTKRYEIE